jgi:hypothetical protein
MGARQPVVGVDEIVVGLDQLGQQLARFLILFAQVEGLGQAQPRPGDCLALRQLPVDRFGQARFAEEQVQFRAQAQEIDRVARVRGLALDAGFDRLVLGARFHQAVDGQEYVALVERARDAFEQAVGGEGFQDVVGRRQLGGADHLAVVALGGDHEKHRGQRNQLVVAQVLEQLLAILAAFEVVFAQHQVETLDAQLLDGLVGAAGVVDAGQAAHRQHAVDVRAHARMGLDEQGTEAV